MDLDEGRLWVLCMNACLATACAGMCVYACRAPTLVNHKLKKNACFN